MPLNRDRAAYDAPLALKKRKPSEAPDYLPPELLSQWQQDRAKKLENKRKRAEALRTALENDHTGRKGKKVKVQLPPTKVDRHGTKQKPKTLSPDDDDSDSEMDIDQLETALWDFVDDEEQASLELPPMDKASRKQMHMIAEAVGLKSQSFGTGDARFTTLIKAESKAKKKVNMGKVDRLFKDWKEGPGFGKPAKGKAHSKTKDPRPGNAKAKGKRHREGDVVGQHAAKIDEGNIGYKLLQSMG